MPGNVKATLGAGSRFSYSTDLGATFTYVEGIEVLPAVNNAAESKEKTTVADSRKVYGLGLKDSADIEIAGIYLPDDSDQVQFLADCDAGLEMDVKLEFPNLKTGGVQRTFKMQPLGVNRPEVSADEWHKFSVPAKQNTDYVDSDLTP